MFSLHVDTFYSFLQSVYRTTTYSSILVHQGKPGIESNACSDLALLGSDLLTE
jgi:hypothetical protein